GPVFDDYGDVIGVASAKVRGKEALALCIPIEDLKSAVDRVAAQSPQDSEAAASRHRQQTVCRLLSMISAKSALGLALYVAGMDAALKRGDPAGQGLNKIAQVIDPRLESLAQVCEGKLKPEVAAITSNDSTPQLVKQHLVELWSKCSSMRSTLDHPSGDVS